MKIHLNHNRKNRRERHGSVVMIFLVSLFAVIAVVALALDYAWLKSANDELRIAAEAGALAAGRNLANDDLLKKDGDQEKWLQRARLAAKQIASENLVAGRPVYLNLDNNEDVRIGKLVSHEDSGDERFIETDNQPNSVVVFARRTRARNNPIVLFFKGVSTQTAGDVTKHAEVTIDNRVIGVRPYRSVPVPAFPLAICKSNLEPIVGKECWDDNIDGKTGADDYRYDSVTNLVLNEGDGIPELTLRYFPKKEDMEKNNVCILDLGNGLRIDEINEQIQTGWKSKDLEDYNGAIRPGVNTDSMNGYFNLKGSILSELREMIGQCRIVLLYGKYELLNRHGRAKVDCPQLVAIRILDVRLTQEGVAEIRVQPGVMTTRTAILSDQGFETAGLLNHYIYKLHLTH